MGAGFLLMVWAVSQRFVTSTVRQRVHLAQAARRAARLAQSAADEGLDHLRRVANRPPKEGQQDLAKKIRELKRKQVLEVAYSPDLSREVGGDAVVEKVRARIWLRSFFPAMNALAFDDCPSLEALERDLARRPVSPAEARSRRAAIFGAFRPARAVGLLELQATARVDTAGIRLSKRLTVRRLFDVHVSPCGKQVAEATGFGYGSIFELHPVEVGRAWESARGRTPRKPQAQAGGGA